jgi:hypothetical protein
MQAWMIRNAPVSMMGIPGAIQAKKGICERNGYPRRRRAPDDRDVPPLDGFRRFGESSGSSWWPSVI